MADSILKSPINYKMEIKRAVVKSLQAEFTSTNYYPGFQSSRLLTESHITIEYPQRPEQYPSIIVGFKEKELKSGGIGHHELTSDNTIIQKWLYMGTISLEIFALTSMDRDFISDSIVNLISFGRIQGSLFRDHVEANANVDLQLSIGSLTPITEETMSGVSWGLTDARIYKTGYEFGCIGSFESGPRYYDYISGVVGATQDLSNELIPVEYNFDI